MKKQQRLESNVTVNQETEAEKIMASINGQ